MPAGHKNFDFTLCLAPELYFRQVYGEVIQLPDPKYNNIHNIDNMQAIQNLTIDNDWPVGCTLDMSSLRQFMAYAFV